MTSAPFSISWSTTLDTVSSLPGTGVEDRMTMSPGLMWMDLCSMDAMRASADMGSPWLPVVMITSSWSGMCFA